MGRHVVKLYGDEIKSTKKASFSHRDPRSTSTSATAKSLSLTIAFSRYRICLAYLMALGDAFSRAKPRCLDMYHPEPSTQSPAYVRRMIKRPEAHHETCDVDRTRQLEGLPTGESTIHEG